MNCSGCGARLDSIECEWCGTKVRSPSHQGREGGKAGTENDEVAREISRLEKKIAMLRRSGAPDEVIEKKVSIAERKIRELLD